MTRTSSQVWGQFGLDPSIGSCTILQDHKKRWINQPRKILNPPNNPGRLKSFSLSLPSLPLALQSWSATPGFSKFHLQLKTGFRTFSCKLQQIAIPTYWWSSTADPFFQITAVLNYNIEPRPLHQDQWHSLSTSCCQRVTLWTPLVTTWKPQGQHYHQFGTTW